MRPAYGKPHQVARVWAELAWQLTWRPSHAHGESFMVASARLVCPVFSCNSVIYTENACFNDCRPFLHGGLHDRLSVASESFLEPSLFSVPIVGNWAQ